MKLTSTRKPAIFTLDQVEYWETLLSSIFALALVAGVFFLQCADDIRRERLAKTGEES